MGDTLSRIRDDEEDARRNRWPNKQARKAECKEVWDKFIAGEAASPLSDILEYARELDEEVKTLRKKVIFSEHLRTQLKLFMWQK